MSSDHDEPRTLIIAGRKRVFGNVKQLAVYRSNLTALFEFGEFMLDDPDVSTNTLETLSMLSAMLNDVLHAEAAWLSELDSELEGQIAGLHAQLQQSDSSCDGEAE